MSKLILMQGLPGSGKSTRAKELAEEYGNVYRVGRDQLREMLHFGDWSGRKEGITRDIQKVVTKSLLEEGHVVIVDDTNIQQSRIDFWRNFAKENNVELEWERMETPIEECIKRDALRPKPVGKNIIVAMAMQAGLYPKPNKGFICCDLDGTLCDIQHRLHYVRTEGQKKDWKSFFNAIPADNCRDEVIEMLQRAKFDGHEIIFLSARPDDHRKATELWLERYYPHYTTLLMRRAGDKRPDTEVKADILDTYFTGKYDIDTIIDDRPSVIRMWKEKGLNVIDVGNGEEF